MERRGRNPPARCRSGPSTSHPHTRRTPPRRLDPPAPASSDPALRSRPGRPPVTTAKSPAPKAPSIYSRGSCAGAPARSGARSRSLAERYYLNVIYALLRGHEKRLIFDRAEAGDRRSRKAESPRQHDPGDDRTGRPHLWASARLRRRSMARRRAQYPQHEEQLHSPGSGRFYGSDCKGAARGVQHHLQHARRVPRQQRPRIRWRWEPAGARTRFDQLDHTTRMTILWIRPRPIRDTVPGGEGGKRGMDWQVLGRARLGATGISSPPSLRSCCHFSLSNASPRPATSQDPCRNQRDRAVPNSHCDSTTDSAPWRRRCRHNRWLRVQPVRRGMRGNHVWDGNVRARVVATTSTSVAALPSSPST